MKKSIGINCLTYDELLTLITEVEAVLNSRPLSCVSSEDPEEPLTPSHLLVGYRVMSLPEPSVPDNSSEALTRRMKHLLKTLARFWSRWKEYLLELREFHRMQAERGTKYDIKKGEVVTVYDEGHPRGLWRLGRIEDVIQSADGGIHGVIVKVTSRKGSAKLLRRPIQHIYLLEVRSKSPDLTLEDHTSPPALDDDKQVSDVEETTPPDGTQMRPVRTAATSAHDRIVGCLMED